MKAKIKIAIACDHRGFEMKAKVLAFLQEKNYEVVDCGAYSREASDYPDFILVAAEKVGKGACSRGIGICYSGIGSAIAANKVKGVRAALCQSVKEAELSRLHNDANMLILGAGFVIPDVLFPIVDTWLTTPFEGGRHERRVNKIKDYERRQGKRTQ
jgi:ribose 5-phosphate isomerase B